MSVKGLLLGALLLLSAAWPVATEDPAPPPAEFGVRVVDAAGAPVAEVPVLIQIANRFRADDLRMFGRVRTAADGVARFPLERLAETLDGARESGDELEAWVRIPGAPAPACRRELPAQELADASLEFRLPEAWGWVELRLEDQRGLPTSFKSSAPLAWESRTDADAPWSESFATGPRDDGAFLVGPVATGAELRAWFRPTPYVKQGPFEFAGPTQHGERAARTLSVPSQLELRIQAVCVDEKGEVLPPARITARGEGPEFIRLTPEIPVGEAFEAHGTTALAAGNPIEFEFLHCDGDGTPTHWARVEWSWDGVGEPESLHDLGRLPLQLLSEWKGKGPLNSPSMFVASAIMRAGRGPSLREQLTAGEPDGSLVAGRVVDDLGEPVAAALITVVPGAKQGEESPPAMAFVSVSTDAAGQFRATLPTRTPWLQLTAEGPAGVWTEVTAIAAGTDQLEVVLPRGGELDVDARFPPEIPRGQVCLRVSGDAGANGGSLGGTTAGEPFSAPVPPGELRVSVGLLPEAWAELLVVEGVQVRSGERTSDPRLFGIDVGALVTRLRLRLVDATGAPVHASEIELRDTDEGGHEELASTPSGEIDVLVPRSRARFTLRVPGHAAVELLPSDARQEIVLQRS